MGTGYNWAGDAIVRDTIMGIRESSSATLAFSFLQTFGIGSSCTESEVIIRALQEIGLPSAREAGTFDIRAWRIWDYVAQNCAIYHG